MAFRRLTREQIVNQLRDISQQGWIKSIRPLNSGGIGNTIDELLGLPENNLPVADSAQWEMKTHRIGSASLITLLHMEPEPRNYRVVVNSLLPNYGWASVSRPGELSFRQTIRATQPTDRGFGIAVNRETQQVEVYFDSDAVQDSQSDWLESVRERIGLGPLTPQPYWSFQEISLRVSTKMLNSFYVEVEARRSQGEELFAVRRVSTLQGFEIDHFLSQIENGGVLVDFDARTHHNHGTKFRLRQDIIPSLYRYVEEIIPST